MVKQTSRIDECPEIYEYIRFVESASRDYPVCPEQTLLAKFVRNAFENETLYINLTQLEQYLSLEKYFPFKLFPWEKFIFTLHNCTYRQDGRPRWKDLFTMVGRGAGKNGYLGFEDFCLLSPYNRRYRVENGALCEGEIIKEYHIDIFANSADQAQMTFGDIYKLLEEAPTKIRRKLQTMFYWNKELIRCRATGSELSYRSASTKTADSRRPGKVDTDELHQFENYDLLGTNQTGLGKKPYPKQTIITTNGDVRDGPLDHYLAEGLDILKGSVPDNGTLPFICRLRDKKDVTNIANWHMANPSLRFFPDLMDEMLSEYAKYQRDNIGNAAFMTKRMNIPQGNVESEVTSWENIKACSRKPKKRPTIWVAGIDFARTTDFISVVLFGIGDGEWVWETHTWVCSQCKDLSRIKYPIQDAAERKLLTIVEDVEIPAEIPAKWLAERMETDRIIAVAIDDYRFSMMKKALEGIGFVAGKDGNIKQVKGRDIMQIAPTLIAQFNRQEIAFGDNSLMRWYINNAKQLLDTRGNVTFGKIEPKTRKTDGFMAAVAATTLLEELEAEMFADSTLLEALIFE